MSVNSINTNTGAMIALQALNATDSALQQTQNEVSTGLKVSSASDNGAIWAIAQDQRSQITALGAVTDSLNRAASTVDVAVSAGQTVSDLLNQMKSKALEASDTSLDTNSRSALNADFQSLLGQIKEVVSNASFNGANLINSTTPALYALSSADGTSKLTISSESLTLGGANLASISTSSSISTSTLAASMVTTLNKDITSVNNAVAKLGTASNAITTSLTFTSNLQNALTTGVGNLVDADVAAESATLTALQTKQQLGVQALSIANTASSTLLSLFKG